MSLDSRTPIFDKIELKSSQWYGWLLAYLTKQYSDHGGRRQNNKDISKYTYVSTIGQINWKFNELNLSNASQDINYIDWYDPTDD